MLYPAGGSRGGDVPNQSVEAVASVGLCGYDVFGVGKCGRGGGYSERDMSGAGGEAEGGRWNGRVVAVAVGGKGKGKL